MFFVFCEYTVLSTSKKNHIPLHRSLITNHWNIRQQKRLDSGQLLLDNDQIKDSGQVRVAFRWMERERQWTYCAATKIARWWFQTFFIFAPIDGEMIQIDIKLTMFFQMG